VKNLYTYQKRDELIDVLRGLAIILVLMLHFHLSYPLVFSEHLSLNFIMNGNYGVTIFFVISGYLISSNALKRYGDLSQISMKHFYFLRCARILPPLVLALIVISLFYALDFKSFTNSVYKEEIYFRLSGLALMTYVYFILGIHGFEAIGFSLMSLGAGLVILSSDVKHFKSNIATKIIAFLGSISYELYLFHIIILGLMRNIIAPKTLSGLSSACLLIVFLLCSVLVGYFIAKFYSERINKMCRRYLASKTYTNKLVMDAKL